MTRGEWVRRILKLKDPVAIRYAVGAVAFLSACEPDVRDELLATALGATADEVRAARSDMARVGLVVEGWIQ